MTTLLLLSALAPTSHAMASEPFVVDNGQVTLSVSRTTGSFSLKWDHAAIQDAFGEAKLPNGSVAKTPDYARHEIAKSTIKDAFGEGTQVVVTHTGAGLPKLRHVISIYNHRAEAMVRLEAVAIGHTNRLVPIATDRRVRLTAQGPLQSLFVPYDNDNYFRYNSQWWGEGDGNGDGSYEVGALYDDSSRRGLVVGSIDHDLWKSAVLFQRNGGMQAVAGVTSKYTHDKDPHGSVAGDVVRSPRFVVGLYRDWRDGLERYGNLNAIVQPPLKWKGEVPFGWNSWSGHKSKVTNEAALAALDFIDQKVPWLRSGGTAYVNFDSFWDNLTREQRVEFCRKVHAAGLKAGIYWTPFVNWGEPDWKTVGDYHYRDLQLKDSSGELLPKLDGGWPLDPTHPGTLKRIDENIADFIDQGFDYIKLDFMTHGSLEGRHYDPKTTTGTAAYRIGMQRVLDDLAKAKRPIFVSLSIAPMFPHGYAHSRRISCDVFSNIGASEYFLNSQNYGWWTARRLYRFNDPDSACVYQALGEKPTTEAEARTRFTASVIGGGMIIEGDDLTNSVARERVLMIFSNREALDLAKKAPEFRPVWGDTAEKAGDAFVYKERGAVYVALFNFTHETKPMAIDPSRLGLSGRWTVHDLWNGADRPMGTKLEATLPATDCALLRLTRSR